MHISNINHMKFLDSRYAVVRHLPVFDGAVMSYGSVSPRIGSVTPEGGP